MTPTRRIFLNVVATYGRSLYTLAIGLFCGRWTLQALGEVDYGLFGLIGGMVAFVTFLNELLASAVGRFFAVSVGSKLIKGNELVGLDECRKWFNSALLIHLAVPGLLIVIGYPIGAWAVKSFLEISPERIGDCIWVWRFTCIGCFLGMCSVPFSAMYTAKQEIAELTIYSVVRSTVNVLVLYYMVTHPRDWLVIFALVSMLLGFIPQLLMVVIALSRFDECRIIYRYMFDWGRIRKLLSFSFARFWTALSHLMNSQGNAILVNKYLGPVFNATVGVGNTVASHANTLSSSISGAFWPAITNKVGEGDLEGMRSLAFRTCKISCAMVLVFTIPLILESQAVLRLWLGNPPEFSWMVCCAVLISMVLERMTEGYWMAIIGEGSGIAFYSLVVSISGFSGFVIAWLALALGYGVYGLCVSIVLAWIITVIVRLVLGKKLVNMSAHYWCTKICLPLVIAMILSFAVGVIPRMLMQESFFRVCMTTVACEAVMLPMFWWVVLDKSEKGFVCSKLARIGIFKRYMA